MRLIYLIFFKLMVVLSMAQSAKDDFLMRWDHSEEYLLKFVELMPEESYGFQPDSGMFTFDEQLYHIIQHISWITHDYLMSNETSYKRPGYAVLSKMERLAGLRSAFQDVREALAVLDDTDLRINYEFRPAGRTLSTLDLLHLLLDHTTHHRGQLVVYLRLNGIQPPPYVGW
jgi:uncharacterized damage-inducible protein DinB